MPTNPQQSNQEFTENTEVDRQSVDRNTAHSWFFDTYYKTLTDIEFSNRQLLDLHSSLNSITNEISEQHSKISEQRSSVARYKDEINRLEKSRNIWVVSVLSVFLSLVACFGIGNGIVFFILLMIVVYLFRMGLFF